MAAFRRTFLHLVALGFWLNIASGACICRLLQCF
jgi:hypothetical protein